MCLSRLGQILYGVGMFVALALTVAGMLTPGWRQLEAKVNQTLSGVTVDPLDPDATVEDVTETLNMGLFSFACTSPGETSGSDAQSKEAAIQYCKDWWKNQPTWEKVVVGLLCATVVLEAVALVYNFVTFCCCCCRGHALKPLAPLALLGFVFVVIAVVVYAFKNRNALEEANSLKELRDPSNQVGYSFFLECVAAALLFGCFVVGSLSACLGKKMCM